MIPTSPGNYHYSDPIGGPAQAVLVCDVDGELIAVFPSLDGDEAGEVPVADMAGDFERMP
ncbi:hypothetical protein ACFPOE_11285 [Caenimonas terrae]|uniref:Uncharacterized protein n=1 Tax=Caenimonas terrae TaxID=696074 RepID=A0ABW0NC12_9BURK